MRMRFMMHCSMVWPSSCDHNSTYRPVLVRTSIARCDAVLIDLGTAGNRRRHSSSAMARAEHLGERHLGGDLYALEDDLVGGAAIRIGSSRLIGLLEHLLGGGFEFLLGGGNVLGEDVTDLRTPDLPRTWIVDRDLVPRS